MKRQRIRCYCEWDIRPVLEGFITRKAFQNKKKGQIIEDVIQNIKILERQNKLTRNECFKRKLDIKPNK